MALFKVTRHAYKPDNPSWGIRKESWYIEAPDWPTVYLYVANDEMTSKQHDLRFKEIDPMLVGPGGHEADVTIDANGQAVDK